MIKFDGQVENLIVFSAGNIFAATGYIPVRNDEKRSQANFLPKLAISGKRKYPNCIQLSKIDSLTSFTRNFL